MAAASSPVTIDALIDSRNWANRLQWCAHDFLEEIASEDGQRVLEDDFLSFWNDRWNVRFLPLLELVTVCKKHGKTTFPYLQSLARERGLYFGHAGFQTEFAHRSAYEIARRIVSLVDLLLPGFFCALKEDCKQVIGELLVRPLWNPKELETQLFGECEYAISRLNDGKTFRLSIPDGLSPSDVVSLRDSERLAGISKGGRGYKEEKLLKTLRLIRNHPRIKFATLAEKMKEHLAASTLMTTYLPILTAHFGIRHDDERDGYYDSTGTTDDG